MQHPWYNHGESQVLEARCPSGIVASRLSATPGNGGCDVGIESLKPIVWGRVATPDIQSNPSTWYSLPCHRNKASGSLVLRRDMTLTADQAPVDVRRDYTSAFKSCFPHPRGAQCWVQTQASIKRPRSHCCPRQFMAILTDWTWLS